jgi:hypothetical protein
MPTTLAQAMVTAVTERLSATHLPIVAAALAVRRRRRCGARRSLRG